MEVKNLNCKVCYSNYNRSDKKPYMLDGESCGHTFCHKCITQLKKKVCPLCRRNFVNKNANRDLLELIPQSESDVYYEKIINIYENSYFKENSNFEKVHSENLEKNITKLTFIQAEIESHAKEMIKKINESQNQLLNEVEIIIDQLKKNYDKLKKNEKSIEDQFFQTYVLDFKNKNLEFDVQYLKEINNKLEFNISQMKKNIIECEKISDKYQFRKITPNINSCFLGFILNETKTNESHRNKGLSYLNENNWESALNSFTLAVSYNRNDCESLINKGTILSKHLNKHEEAIKCFEEVIKIDAKSSLAHNNKGFVFYSLGRFEESIDCYNQAICINPSDELAYTNKGLSLVKLNNLVEAIKCFQIILEINPNNVEALNNANYLRSLIFTLHKMNMQRLFGSELKGSTKLLDHFSICHRVKS